jgi:hypothetical protein
MKNQSILDGLIAATRLERVLYDADSFNMATKNIGSGLKDTTKDSSKETNESTSFKGEASALGERADSLIDSGQADQAIDIYQSLANNLKKQKEADGFLIAKMTLGLLKAYCSTGQFRKAFELWNSTDAFYARGVLALENAQVALDDLITYDMICAHLHSLQNSDQNAMASALTQYMSRVCEHAEESGNRNLMYHALSNWKQHLREVYHSTIPFEWAKPLIAFEQKLGDQVRLGPIGFPKLSNWVRAAADLELTVLTTRRSSAASSAKPAISSQSQAKKRKSS